MTVPLDVPVHLDTKASLPVRDGRGLEIRCIRGNLWITQAGDGRDVILYAGESFTLDRRGLALITALLQPADVVVEATVERSAPPRDEVAPDVPIAA